MFQTNVGPYACGKQWLGNFMKNEDHIQGKESESWKHFLQKSMRQGQKRKACFPEMVTFNGMNYLQSLKSVYSFWSVSKWSIIHPDEKEREQLNNMTSD